MVEIGVGCSCNCASTPAAGPSAIERNGRAGGSDVRRSEVAAAAMQNLVKVDAQTCVYGATYSKTHQTGTEHNPLLHRYIPRIHIRKRVLLIDCTG
jgi:hypothetical protein